MCVTGHRKRQFELHRRQTNSLSFSKFVNPHSTYNNMTHSRPVTGAFKGAMVVYNRTIMEKTCNKLFHELGDTPLWPMGEKRSRPRSRWRTPRAPLNNLIRSYARKNTFKTRYKKLQSYKQLSNNKKSLRARGDPLRPPEESHSKSRSRQGPPELYYINSIQTTSNAQGEICYKLQIKFLHSGIYEQKDPLGQLAPSGEACSSKEYGWRNPLEMANSRGLALTITITTQLNFP